MNPYLQIARVDHWFKNVFMLPGVLIALTANPDLLSVALLYYLALAFLAAGLVASSNYVINEIVDAPFDRQHPVKCRRPIPAGRVDIRLAYGLWLALAAAGLLLAWAVGWTFFLCAALLWVMGLLYNLRPIRLKDRVFLDVLTESVNNPIRLLLGWYGTGATLVVPVSLVIAYWMLGAFFMAIKRFAEYRLIGDPRVAAKYRRSFAGYDEEKLLLSIVYYAVSFGLFFGVFLLRYRVELIVSLPLLAGFMAWYIHIGFQHDSPAQYPEHLYRLRGFTAYTVLCAAVMVALLYIDIPLIAEIFSPTISLN